MVTEHISSVTGKLLILFPPFLCPLEQFVNIPVRQCFVRIQRIHKIEERIVVVLLHKITRLKLQVIVLAYEGIIHPLLTSFVCA